MKTPIVDLSGLKYLASRRESMRVLHQIMKFKPALLWQFTTLLRARAKKA